MKPGAQELPAEDESSEDRKPAWRKRIPVQILIIAILTSMLSMIQGYYNSNRYYNLAMLEQIQAQDLWSLYNAKEVQDELAGLERESLNRERFRAGEADKLSRYLDYSAVRVGRLTDQLAREKNGLYLQAKAAEQARDAHLATAQDYFRMDKRLATAIFLFQISILCLSVASLVKQVGYYQLGNLSVVLALVMLYNSFFSFVELYR